MKKYELTREILEDNGIWVELDEEGRPTVFQRYEKTGERDLSKSWKESRPSQSLKAKHSYGKDLKYNGVTLRINGKTSIYLLSNIAWVWFRGPIPRGYDCDHINGDSLDDRMDNYQLLTRKENLGKREFRGSNQYVNSSDPEYFRRKKEEIRMKKERSLADIVLRNRYTEEMKQICLSYEKIREEIKNEGNTIAGLMEKKKELGKKSRMSFKAWKEENNEKIQNIQ